jgi:hypothetical protein
MENKLTFEEFIVRASAHQIQVRDQRLGQAYFNTLVWHRPDLAEQIRGSRMYDPFHDDNKFPAFLDFITTNW